MEDYGDHTSLRYSLCYFPMNDLERKNLVVFIGRLQRVVCYAILIIVSCAFLYAAFEYGFDLIEVRGRHGEVQFRIPGILAAGFFLVLGSLISGIGLFAANFVLKKYA